MIYQKEAEREFAAATSETIETVNREARLWLTNETQSIRRSEKHFARSCADERDSASAARLEHMSMATREMYRKECVAESGAALAYANSMQQRLVEAQSRLMEQQDTSEQRIALERAGFIITLARMKAASEEDSGAKAQEELRLEP